MFIHLAIKVGKDENLLETLSHRERCSTSESKWTGRRKKKAGNYYATIIREKFTKLICNKKAWELKIDGKAKGHKVLYKKSNTLANVLKFIDIFQWHGMTLKKRTKKKGKKKHFFIFIDRHLMYRLIKVNKAFFP